MPDGTVVAMPDTPDPELDARLHNAYVTQTNAKASGLNPGTPEWDKMTRGNVSMGDQTPAPSMGENILRGAAGLTRMGINAVGAPLVSAATHAVMGAGHDLIDPRINPEGGQIHAPAPLGPVDQAVGNAIGHVTGALQGAGDTVESHLPQPVQHGIDTVAQAAGNTAPLIMPGGEGGGEIAAPAAAVARSPADVAQAAGYTGLKTRADMARPGNQAVTNTLIGQDAGVPKGTVPSVAAVTDARNAGPGGVYNKVQNSIPKNLTQDAQLQTGIKSLQDSTSQLPRSPDVEALQQTMLGQPDMTSQQLFSNIQQARERASANMASDDPDKNAIGKAYGQLADHYEDFAGRSILPGSDVNIKDFTDARTQFAKSYAAQAALKGGENFDPATYAKLAQNNPGMLTGNAAVVANVHNNLPAGASAAGTGHSYYAPMAAGSVAGSALGAGLSHLTGVPGLAEAGGLAGLGVGPMAQNALKNFSTRGNPEAAAAAQGNPALSYFRRGIGDQMAGPAPLNLTPPPGTVFDQLQHEMSVPQGPGPNPDLKMTPPPGNARPVLSTQTDMVSPQGPGGVNKNLPQSPPGTGGLQPGLFDQIEAPPSAGPRNMPLGGEIGGNYVEPGSKVYSTGPQNDPHSMLSVSPRDDGSLHVSSVHTKPEAQGQGLASQHLADAASDAAADGTPLHSDVVNSPSMVRTLDSAKRNGLVDFDIKHPEAYQRGLNAPKSKAPIKTPTPLVENIRPAAAPSDYPGGFRRDRGMIQDGANYRAPSISDQIAGP
jgi:hypothetical protein